MCGLQGTTLQLSTYNTPALAFLGLPFFHRCGCIFAADHHWALFWGEGDHSHWTGTYVDGLPGSLHVHAERLASCLSTLKGHLHWTFDVSSIFPHEAPCTCGTIALLFLKVFLGLSVPHSPNVILDLRHLLLRSQPAICRSSELLIGLGPYPVEQQLAVLLQTKGFQLPKLQSEQRLLCRNLELQPIRLLCSKRTLGKISSC